MERADMKPAMRRGLVVAIALAVMIAVEFIVSVVVERTAAVPIIVVLVLTQATLIVYHFMHLPQLWQREE